MKKLMFACLCAALVYGCGNPQPAAEEKTETAPADTTPKAAEIGDPSLMETGKSMFAAMSEGNMDKYMEPFAEDAKYYWNGGDSLAGKPAIDEFWRKRRAEALTSVAFNNQIWIPVKVNQPQSVEMPGNWLLGWSEVTATYTNGNSMTQWMHWTIHFNEAGKVDMMSHYADMAPINAAFPTKK